MRWAVIIGVTVAGGIAGFASLVVWIAREHSWQWDETAGEAWEVFTGSFVVGDDWGYVLVTLLPAVVAFSVARRMMGRSAVRRVLRRRGLCDWCGYGVAGLPINASGGIVCPECSRVSGVAAVLGEPATGVFVPNTGLKAARFWTKRRVVRGAVGFAAVAVVGGGVWGVWAAVRHWQVMADAELAKADRVTLKEYRAVLPEPVVPEGAQSAFELVAAIKAGTDRVEKAVRAESNQDYSVFFDPVCTIEGEVEPSAENEKTAQFTGRVLDAWLADGGKAQLAALAGPLDYSFSPVVDTDGVITDFNAWNLASTRHAMRICRAMAWRAWKASDPSAWLAAAKAHVATGRCADQSPTMIGRLVAAATESALLGDIRARLFDLRARPPGDARTMAWLDAFDAAIAELAGASSPLPVALRGERLFMRHHVAGVFVDAAAIKSGDAEKAATQPSFLAPGSDGRLGRYRENLDALNRVYDEVIAAAGQRLGEREPQPTPQLTGLAMVDTLRAAVYKFLLTNDQVAQLRIAVATMVAIERRRQVSGGYPETLDGVLPVSAVGPPLDLCGKGGPLVYRRSADAEGRPWYTLYSVGIDGEDNGGAAPMILGMAFYEKTGSQMDAVYSDPKVK
ncbi:MAG: hypothetical protein Q8L55_03610 [Phycisphaerales bacterium]|nr:hypothetical protein [Phycisphaerales bacterium]